MNSLSARLIAGSLLVLTVFVGLTGLAVSYSVYQRAEQAAEDRMEGLVFGILGATEVDASGELLVRMGELPERTLALDSAGLYAEIVGARGKRLWQSRSIIDSVPPVQQTRIGQWQRGLVELKNGERARRMQLQTVWELDNGDELPFIVHVVDARTDDARALTRFTRSLWATLLGAAAVLLALQLGVLRAALGPLRRLGQDIDAMSNGDQAVSENDIPKELSPLVGSINALHARERQRHESYRHLLNDLAHNLKTPLAILGNLNDPRVDTQASSMQRSIDRYLQRAATETTTTLSAPVTLLPVLDRVAESMRKLYAHDGLGFDHRVPADATLRVPEADLYEVIGNLYDNACKYGASKIVTRLEDSKLYIEDNGKGFDSAQPDTLLRRGMREDTRTDGEGIGLASVSQLVSAWGGTVSLGESSSGGACCVLDVGAVLVQRTHPTAPR